MIAYDIVSDHYLVLTKHVTCRFSARSTPTNQGNYPLLGFLSCEVILWNDLRYERALKETAPSSKSCAAGLPGL